MAIDAGVPVYDRRLVRRIALGLALFLAAEGSLSSAPQRSWVFATATPSGSPTAQLVEQLTRELEKATGIKIRLRFDAVLGTEAQMTTLLRTGKIQLWAGSTGALADHVPALTVLESPYLFADVPAFARSMAPAVLERPAVDGAFRSADVWPFGGYFLGWRAMSSRSRPLLLPADVKGVKMRAQPAPLHAAMWKRLGAQGLPIDLPEVAGAFKTGIVDAADLPALFLLATAGHTVLRHHVRTEHMLQSVFVAFHRPTFEALPEPVRAAIRALRPAQAERVNARHEALEGELVAALEQAMEVVVPTADQRAAWRTSLAPLEADARRLGGRAGADLLDAVRARLR